MPNGNYLKTLKVLKMSINTDYAQYYSFGTRNQGDSAETRTVVIITETNLENLQKSEIEEICKPLDQPHHM